MAAFDPEKVNDIGSIDDARATRAPCRAQVEKCCAASTSTIGRSWRIRRSAGWATQGPDSAVVSPRSDPPGFCCELDDRHLLLPDRVGDNRFDCYANVRANPRTGLLFLVPGMGETLRINGTARVTDDEALLAPSAHNGRVPKMGLVVTVLEAHLHCAKAINRSGLWDASKHVDRATIPSYNQMLADQVMGLTMEESLRQAEEMARRGLY